MWIAGIAICELATSGTVAIVRSIPASRASIPGEGAPSMHSAAASESENADAQNPQADGATTKAAINGRNRTWCPECGVIESMRQIQPTYELTVRFRDGSTIVFNEATERSWRSGNRVIVIRGANSSTN